MGEQRTQGVRLTCDGREADQSITLVVEVGLFTWCLVPLTSARDREIETLWDMVGVDLRLGAGANGRFVERVRCMD